MLVKIMDRLKETYEFVYRVHFFSRKTECLKETEKECAGKGDFYTTLMQRMIPEDVELYKALLNEVHGMECLSIKSFCLTGKGIRQKMFLAYGCVVKESVESLLVTFSLRCIESELPDLQRDRYRLICQGSGILTLEYHPDDDAMIYSTNEDHENYHEIEWKNFCTGGYKKELFSPKGYEEFVEAMQSLLSGEEEEIEPFEVEADSHNGHGLEMYWVRLIAIKDNAGTIKRIIGRANNIQKIIEEEKYIHHTEAVVRAALTTDAVLSMRLDLEDGMRIVEEEDVVPKFLENVLSVPELAERITKRIHFDDVAAFVRMVNTILLAPSFQADKTIKTTVRAEDGNNEDAYGCYEIIGTYIYNQRDHRREMYITAVDCTEEYEYRRKKNVSNVDNLTGLFNREAFDNLVEKGDENQFSAKDVDALAMIRIDKFYQIQQKYQMYAVEEVIQQLADKLKTHLGEHIWAARYADATFALLLVNESDHRSVKKELESIQRHVNLTSGNGELITVSIGAVECHEAMENRVSELLEKAYFELGAAQTAGGNRIRFWDEDHYNERPTLKKDVYLRMFGHFEIFVKGQSISFSSKKAKEMLALLADRRGGQVSVSETISVLWENEPANEVSKARCRKVYYRLRNTLKEYGIEDIVANSGRSKFLNMQLVHCDYFDYLAGRGQESELFKGRYLEDYSWGEETVALLTEMEKSRNAEEAPEE